MKPQTYTTERTWRNDVIAQSLQGFNNEKHMDAALCAISELAPQFSTYQIWPEREQTLKFMNLHCRNVRSLLPAQSFFEEDKKDLPFTAWYGLTWENTEIEVVLIPGWSNGAVLCLSEDPAILVRFGRALGDYAERPLNRCLRYAAGWENAPDLDEIIGQVTWDDVVLPPAILSSVRESVETFFAHKETIQKFGFAWKRGILLVGPPGTGKTMICKAAAAALPELPFLYVRDLRERSKKESIESIFARARKLAPCILAMEDLDSLITPENRTVFLNEMDGFQSNDGILIVASSNHPGKIDEALLKRPSRFDRVFHLGLPELAERRAFCEKVLRRSGLSEHLSSDLDVNGLIEKVAAKTEGFTPAYLKEAFTSAALQRAQEGSTLLDDEFADAVLKQIQELKTHLKKVKNPDAMVEMRSGDDSIGFRR